MLGFIKLLVFELVKLGVMVNVICLGFIEMEMVMVMLEEVCVKVVVKILICCLGYVEEIVCGVVYLVKDGVYIIG